MSLARGTGPRQTGGADSLPCVLHGLYVRERPLLARELFPPRRRSSKKPAEGFPSRVHTSHPSLICMRLTRSHVDHRLNGDDHALLQLDADVASLVYVAFVHIRIPWPTYSRTTPVPSAQPYRLLPGRAALIPAHTTFQLPRGASSLYRTDRIGPSVIPNPPIQDGARVDGDDVAGFQDGPSMKQCRARSAVDRSANGVGNYLRRIRRWNTAFEDQRLGELVELSVLMSALRERPLLGAPLRRCAGFTSTSAADFLIMTRSSCLQHLVAQRCTSDIRTPLTQKEPPPRTAPVHDKRVDAYSAASV